MIKSDLCKGRFFYNVKISSIVYFTFLRNSPSTRIIAINVERKITTCIIKFPYCAQEISYIVQNSISAAYQIREKKGFFCTILMAKHTAAAAENKSKTEWNKIAEQVTYAAIKSKITQSCGFIFLRSYTNMTQDWAIAIKQIPEPDQPPTKK